MTACRDGSAQIWLAADRLPGETLRHGGAVYSAAWSPDGRRLLTASADGAARLWDVEPAVGEAPGATLHHGSAVRAAAFSPDGRRLATASTDGTVRLWDAATGEPLGEPLFHESAVGSVGWSPDGRRLVSASESAARIWELAAGRSVATPMRHPAIRAAAFHPEGRQVLTASWDGSVRLWWVAPPRPGAAPSGTLVDRGSPTAAFSPGGRRLAAGGWDGAVRIWRLSEPMDRTVGQHRAVVYSVGFSPDGRFLVTASEDGTARIWSARSDPDVESLEALLPPAATTDGAGEVVFEIDRVRPPALLVSRPGYHPPAPHPLGRGNSAFVAELSATSTPSRIRELPAAPAAAPARPGRWVGEAVSLSLRGADLVETLRSFATISHLNMFFAPGIAGTLDLDLVDVPWDQAFEEILRSHDLVITPSPGPPAGPDPPAGLPVWFAHLDLIVPQDGRTLAPESPVLRRFPAGEPIDMSLKEADLVETLRSFAMISDFDWTIDPDVAGTVSAEVRDLPWTQVLAAILRLHDLRLEVAGNHWRIRRERGERPPRPGAEP